ncbi:MAG: mannosyltransferase [Ginsengibacter sp.]
MKDDFPVLLEGIHCTYFLFRNELKGRKVIVRLHNVEYQYYRGLANSSKNILKKLYFVVESRLLKKYERDISNKAVFLAVSEMDKQVYIEEFASKNIDYLPVFLPFNEVSSKAGRGTYCLYHGNLSVPENEKAVLWILKNVFNSLTIPFVIAGKNPSKYLHRISLQNKNVCLVANPSQPEMDDLIKKAHVHILPSLNKTGIKIKLLNALFNGKFILTNNAAVEGTGVSGLCEIAESGEEYKKILSHLFKKPFSENDIANRSEILFAIYNNEINVKQLMQWIW